MKTKTTQSKFLILCLLTAFSFNSVGQQVAEKKEIDWFALNEQKQSLLPKLQVTLREDHPYAKWYVISEKQGGVCVLQRSKDGVNFKPISVKEYFSAPVPLKVAYCFADKSPFSGKSYYRLLKISEDGTCLYSDAVPIENGGYYAEVK